MKISERSFNSKHSAYYIDGTLIKNYEDIQKGLSDKRLIEKLDMKTGDRRYLDFKKEKWLQRK